MKWSKFAVIYMKILNYRLRKKTQQNTSPRAMPEEMLKVKQMLAIDMGLLCRLEGHGLERQSSFALTLTRYRLWKRRMSLLNPKMKGLCMVVDMMVIRLTYSFWQIV